MSSLAKALPALALLAAFALTGCGFHPVYGKLGPESDTVAAEDLLSRTEVAMIPDREGVYLRNQLIDRFYLDGRPVDPLYTLRVSRIEEQTTDLDITKSSDATRGQLRLSTTIVLIDREGRTALMRPLTAITSYNILAGEFTNRVSEEAARRNALDDLARQIESRVTLYFNRLD